MLRFAFVLIVFAVATYLVVRAMQRAGSGPQAPRPTARRRPPTTIAPDDDEDFLRELDRRRLHPDDPEGSGS